MTEAVFCDKCKKLKNPAEENMTKIVISGMYNDDGEFDLCPKCKDDLSEFLMW